MERCGGQYNRARSSFEKAHGGEAPPRLQVIGFNVLCAPKAETKEGILEIMKASQYEASNSSHLLSLEKKPSPSLPKPASSPRSALQQLLLNQSLPSSNHSLPHGLLPLPPSPSSPSSGLPSSTNHNSTTGLQLQQPAISPPAANQNLTTPQPAFSPPAGNQNLTSGVSKQPPPAYQSIKSLLQSENASSNVPANQLSPTGLCGQSQCTSSSSSSGNQSLRGFSVSVNAQMINQRNSKPSQAPLKENYEAFFRIKQTDDEEKKKFNNGNHASTHEIKGRFISAKEVINELPHVEKSKKSSWLQHPSPENCKKNSCNGVQQINEPPFGNEKSRKSSWNEEKSKKSSLFMFVVNSPAPEFHHHYRHGEYNMSPKDMDFLSSCHLCRRFLGQGEDVFMYSGDKAFCSMDCRYQQIVIDERKERCPPPIIRSGASQVYQHTSITTTTTTTAATTHHPIMINKPHFIKTAAAA